MYMTDGMVVFKIYQNHPGLRWQISKAPGRDFGNESGASQPSVHLLNLTAILMEWSQWDSIEIYRIFMEYPMEYL